MTKNKIASGVLGLAMVFAFAAPSTAGAQTIAELQALVNQLMAQIAALQGGTTVSTGVAFTSNLTVGSTGAEVTALQQMLVAQGHLTMPAGVAYGYFGPLTRTALASWQAANGVSPASGYWGPISRARAAALGHTGGTTTGGTVTTPGTTTGGITTPGVEGVMSVTLAPVPGAGGQLEEGDSKEKVLGMEIEADLSDIRVERIKVKLDQASGGTADRDFYRDIADKMYVMDGSDVLASVDLNSSTVIEETSGNYYVTITGLNFVVKKDQTKTLTLALDAQSSWDSDYDNDTWTVTVPAEGVRAVDGAGINLYSAGAIARTFTSVADSAESATLTFSTNTDTPEAAIVVAASGSDNDEKDGVEILRFDIEAEDDDVTLTDLVVDITRGGVTTTATATTAYLYHGSTLIASASVAGTSATAMTATFDDIEVMVDEDDTETLSVEVDIIDAGTGATTFLASITVDSDVVAENSAGDAVTESGSATGETITVLKVGPEFSLVSKSITKGSTASQNNTSTSTVQADFVVRVKAVGGDIILGTTASGTPFATNAGTAGTDDDPTFTVYKGGASQSLSVASTSSVTIPTGAITTGITNGFKVTKGNSVDVPVSFLFEGRTEAGALVSLGSYAVGISQLNWISVDGAGLQHSDFMSGETDWRTSSVQLP